MISPRTPNSSSTPSSSRAFCSSAAPESCSSTVGAGGSISRSSGGSCQGAGSALAGPAWGDPNPVLDLRFPALRAGPVKARASSGEAIPMGRAGDRMASCASVTSMGRSRRTGSASSIQAPVSASATSAAISGSWTTRAAPSSPGCVSAWSSSAKIMWSIVNPIPGSIPSRSSASTGTGSRRGSSAAREGCASMAQACAMRSSPVASCEGSKASTGIEARSWFAAAGGDGSGPAGAMPNQLRASANGSAGASDIAPVAFGSATGRFVGPAASRRSGVRLIRTLGGSVNGRRQAGRSGSKPSGSGAGRSSASSNDAGCAGSTRSGRR